MEKAGTGLNEIYIRLKNNYPDLDIYISGDILTVQTILAKAEVRGNHVSFYMADKLIDETDAEGDELYAAIEGHLLSLYEDEKYCSSLYMTAEQKLRKDSNKIMCISAALMLLCAVIFITTKSMLFGILFIAVPVVMNIPKHFVRLSSLRKNWVCPHCGTELPVDKKLLSVKVHYTKVCPSCGAPLIDGSLVEEARSDLIQSIEEDQEWEEEEEAGENVSNPVVLGNSVLRIISGILIFLTALVFTVCVSLNFDKALPAVILNIISLVSVTAAALVLLICHIPKAKIPDPSYAAACEKSFVGVFGVFANMLGCVSLLFSFAFAPYVSSEIGVTAFLTVYGILMLVLGVWMILARNNRRFYILPDSVCYTTSFGRVRSFHNTDIAAVNITGAKSIKFVDRNGRRLFSLELNMRGSDRVIDWIDRRKFNLNLSDSLKNQLEECNEIPPTISWKEVYRSKLHGHMGAVRIALVISVVLYLAGCIVTFALYILGFTKIFMTIYLSAFAPVPMVIFCIAAAPVIVPDDPPEGATKEWRSMFIKFPMVTVSLAGLALGSQVYAFWSRYTLQLADLGKFLLMVLVVSLLIIAAMCMRIQKSMKKMDGFVMLIMCAVLWSYTMTYGVVAASASAPEHYPAVITETREPADSDDPYTVKVELSSGDSMDYNVSESVYDVVKSGEKLDVCQRNSIFGIRLIRLHYPKSDE